MLETKYLESGEMYFEVTTEPGEALILYNAETGEEGIDFFIEKVLEPLKKGDPTTTEKINSAFARILDGTCETAVLRAIRFFQDHITVVHECIAFKTARPDQERLFENDVAYAKMSGDEYFHLGIDVAPFCVAKSGSYMPTESYVALFGYMELNLADIINGETLYMDRVC